MHENQPQQDHRKDTAGSSGTPDSSPDKGLFSGSVIIPEFIAYAWARFTQDRCWRMAAGLSYTSLLAVVPLTAIAFSMLAAFPVFEGVKDRFQDVVFANFLPQSAAAMRSYFDQFIQNTTTLSAVGIVGLAATAVLLLGTIEADLNAIFRVRKPRPLVPRLLVFWAMITLGPLLVGASFSLATYAFVAGEWMGLDVLAGPLGWIGRFVPTLLIIAGLAVFYMVIPNRHVPPRAALVGGIVAGILFALLRKVFGWYVATFPTYQNVYGALSVVPIFLIWMYLSWSVVLLGAVITTTLGEWFRAGGKNPDEQALDSGMLDDALIVLKALFQHSREGRATGSNALLEETALAEDRTERVLEELGASGFVALTADEGWVISRDMNRTTLFELFDALSLPPHLPSPTSGEDLSSAAAVYIINARKSIRDSMDIPLAELLSEET